MLRLSVPRRERFDETLSERDLADGNARADVKPLTARWGVPLLRPDFAPGSSGGSLFALRPLSSMSSRRKMTAPEAARACYTSELRSHLVAPFFSRPASIGAVSILLTFTLQGHAGAADSEPPSGERDPATSEPGPPATTSAPAAAPQKAAPAPPSTWSSISEEQLARDPRPSSPPPRPPKLPQRWYGWQILISDLTTVALFLNGTGGYSPTSPVVYAWALVPPAIHALHDQGMAAVWSLGLRAAVPLVAKAFLSSCHSKSDDDTIDAGCITLPVLVAFGAVAAMGVDVSNSYEDIRPPSNAIRIAPRVTLSERHGYLGLVGSF